jgi:hypothetical protein
MCAEVTGGNIATSYIMDVARRLSTNRTRARVGFFDGQPAPLVAAVAEFGSAKQPPRPFCRNMIAANQVGRRWRRIC